MGKYQFFVKPDTNRQQFTFLRSGSESFLKEKQQLIEQGFLVEDDYIYAENDQEAVDKFRSNYTYALEEYYAANPLMALVMALINFCKGAPGRSRK